MDPFYEKHGFSPQTYIRGPRGIDKALIDRGSYPALRAIGYLATHDGAYSDHVVGFMDWDAQLFSQGLINRLPRHHSRDITFDQSDKVKQHLEELIKQASGRKLMERTTRLAAKPSIEKENQASQTNRRLSRERFQPPERQIVGDSKD